jgi:hypothetical protein
MKTKHFDKTILNRGSSIKVGVLDLKLKFYLKCYQVIKRIEIYRT